MIVVYIDAWTAYGGSQFVDSPGTGRYMTYICDEIVPWVDAKYRTMPEPAHRGIMGKSSGGFGAMILPMLRPDLFGGFATHAGDTLYECCYIPEFAKTVRALREYDGDIFAWWKDFRSRVAFTKETDRLILMTLGVAACFSARDDGTPELPFDPHTGRLRDDIWAKWLAWDPVRMVPQYADALRTQRAIWIDAGTRDDWYLDLGATAFRDRAGEDRRDRRQVRAVRCHARGHRLSLRAVTRVSRGPVAVIRLRVSPAGTRRRSGAPRC